MERRDSDMKYLVPKNIDIHRYDADVLEFQSIRPQNYIHELIQSTHVTVFDDEDIIILKDVTDHWFFKLPKEARPWTIIGVFKNHVEKI